MSLAGWCSPTSRSQSIHQPDNKERRRSMPRTSLLVASLLLAAATVAEAQAVGNRVKVNGMQMYYEVSGAGDPIIVLHGAYMNIPTMGAIIPQLAQTPRVYALELQGHGR